jgi:hypothetical protein
MTRATRLLLSGGWYDAWKMHPLVYALPALGLLWLADARAYYRTGAWGAVMGQASVQRLIVSLAIVAIVLWASRFFGAWGGPVPV